MDLIGGFLILHNYMHKEIDKVQKKTGYIGRLSYQKFIAFVFSDGQPTKSLGYNIYSLAYN